MKTTTIEAPVRHARTGQTLLSLTCVCGDPADGLSDLGLCGPCANDLGRKRAA